MGLGLMKVGEATLFQGFLAQLCAADCETSAMIFGGLRNLVPTCLACLLDSWIQTTPGPSSLHHIRVSSTQMEIHKAWPFGAAGPHALS